MNPAVTVIIPVYNCERYIEEAVESVFAQSFLPLEVIVIDDGSTDETAARLRRWGSRLQYQYQPNEGLASARNAGIRMATAGLLAFLDSDDLWTPTKLEHQVAVLKSNDGVDLVCGMVQSFYSPEVDDDFRARIRCLPDPVSAPVVGAMLIRKEAFLKVGWFETQLQVGTDMSWHLRAREAGLKLEQLDEVVLLRRLHPANRGITHRGMISHRLHALKASLDRRRRRTE